MTSKLKNQYYQLIRGIAIVFVILIHCTSGLLYSTTSIDYHIYIVLRCAIGCAVPLFFTLSGYFSSRNKSKKNSFFDFRLIIPFIIWSVIYLICNSGVTSIFTLKGLVKIVTGQSAPHLYFIFVLLQMRLLMPILHRYKGRILDILIALITAIWFLLYYFSDVFCVINISMPFSFVDFFPAWIIYWYIGFRVNDSSFIKNIKTSIIATLAFLAFILTVAETYCFAFFSDVANPATQIKFSTLLFCLLICVLIFKREKTSDSRNILTYIGDYSYGIYYIHFLFVYAMNKYIYITLQFPLLLVWAIQLPLILILSLTAIKTTRFLLGKKISGDVFGF